MSLLGEGQVKNALDIWESGERELGLRSRRYLPDFLIKGLEARALSKSDQWEDALTSYQSMFNRADMHQGPFDVRDGMAALQKEYREAILDWYANRKDFRPETLLRKALWLWRDGRIEEALQIINTAISIEGTEQAVHKRLEAYRSLLYGRYLESCDRIEKAAESYMDISSSEPPVYWRGILSLYELQVKSPQENLKSEKHQLIFRYFHKVGPSIGLEYFSSQLPVCLVGAEILEPELIEDGGILEVLLFWQAIQEQGPTDLPQEWLPIDKMLYMQKVTARNLITDPGFEWGEEGLRRLYGEAGNAPSFETVSINGFPTRIVSLSNQEIGKNSGFSKFVSSVRFSDRFLLAARMKGTGNANGVLMGNWLESYPSSKLFYAGEVVNNADWQWIGGVVTPTVDSRVVQVYIVNYEAVGRVWADDLVMLQLPPLE
jgi:tetratricopeptide (TPR) repeat protein